MTPKPTRLLTLAFTLLAALAALGANAQQPTPATFPSSGHTIAYERFASTTPNAPILVELPGTSGPQSAFYRDQARFYAAHGYDTLLLDYFSATASHSPSPANYEAWADALTALVRLTLAATPTRPVYVLGYSLGASIALAAGSQSLPVQAIAEWYGSLPDEFFYKLQATQSRMPPLLILHGQQDSNIPVANAQQLITLCQHFHFTCDSHLYPGQDHGFAEPALTDARLRTLAFFALHPASTPIP